MVTSGLCCTLNGFKWVYIRHLCPNLWTFILVYNDKRETLCFQLDDVCEEKYNLTKTWHRDPLNGFYCVSLPGVRKRVNVLQVNIPTWYEVNWSGDYYL